MVIKTGLWTLDLVNAKASFDVISAHEVNISTYFGLCSLTVLCLSHCRCCEKESCEIAFMIDGNCYGVHCFDQELCKIRRAKSSKLSPMLSFVTREGMSKSLLFIQYFLSNGPDRFLANSLSIHFPEISVMI